MKMKRRSILKKSSILNKRSEDRGKRRFEERDEFFNDSFMHNFQERRRAGPEGNGGHNANGEHEVFSKKGKDIKLEINISFYESIKGTTKGMIIQRDVKCPACEGSRSETHHDIPQWYSCGGEGVKKDQLFGNLTRWNTCQGHGKIPKNICNQCKGTGLNSVEVGEHIQIPPLTEHEDMLRLENLGHHSEYLDKISK